MQKSTRRWLKAAVVTFGVVDCVGIYIAHDRLSRPAATDAGDLAYAVPAPTSAFVPDRQPAEAASAPASAAPRVDVQQFASGDRAMTSAVQVPAATAPAVTLVRADPLAERKRGASAAEPAQLSRLLAPRAHAPLFADAFGSGFAAVPLDAPITVPLPDAPADEALAEAEGAIAVELAQNDGPAGADTDAEAERADSLPEAGPAAILPDSDVL